jgi:acyl-CoA synthetase (AMP-forming)/AMP-acid ligase II
MQDTLGAMFVRSSERFPERLAVRSSNGDRTYQELIDNAARLANTFTAHGLKPGDRVAIMLENCVEAIEIVAGIAIAGLVVVPVNGHFKSLELDHQLRDSGARALVHTDGAHGAVSGASVSSSLEVILHVSPTVEPAGNVVDYHASLADADPKLRLYEAGPDDLAVLGYTSGTTGFPKGVIVPQRTLALCIRTCVGALRIPHYSRLAYIGSLGYAAPWWTIILPHLFVGGMVNLLRNYTIDSWFEAMAEDKTTFTYVPSPLITSFVEKGRQHPEIIARLETVNHSASAATRREIEALVSLVGDKYFHGWGATEIVGVLTCLTRNDAIGLSEAENRWATVGRPAPTCRLFVLDDDGNELPPGKENVGEFAVEVDTLFSGYWNQPEQTAAAIIGDRYLTGDVGYVDQAGYAYIVDRKRDMIVSGGANVYPAEVERVLLEFDDIAEIAVFGIPHERWGESVAAAIVRTPGSTITEDDVVRFSKANLAGFKKPTAVIFLDELPRNASQKVRKDVLRAEWSKP